MNTKQMEPLNGLSSVVQIRICPELAEPGFLEKMGMLSSDRKTFMR